MVYLIVFAIGFTVGLAVEAYTVNTYFGSHEDEIIWKGRKYVFTDKSDIDDCDID